MECYVTVPIVADFVIKCGIRGVGLFFWEIFMRSFYFLVKLEGTRDSGLVK